MIRDKNMNSELENAFNKELNIIKNDLYYQQLEFERYGEQKIVRFDIFYRPMEILSGDSYSIRKNYDEKIMFFIVDAMGKGVTASLTATSSTTLLNYIFDQMQRAKNFEFKRWIECFVDFIRDDLLDNEMLAGTFGLYDRTKGEWELAMFGMPAMLICDKEGNIRKIKSNNMPINKYTYDFNIDTICTPYARKLLIYTDGLCESKMGNGEFYKLQMYQDFVDSASISDFTNIVRQRLQTDQDDDTAYFYIDVPTPENGWNEISIKGTRDEMDSTLETIRNFIVASGANVKESSEIILAMSEILLNSVEHGIYGIDKYRKSELIEKGEFDDVLDRLESENKDMYVNIKYSLRVMGGKKVIVIKVVDPGKGFDVRELRQLVVNPKSFNGRGIMIIKKLVDRFYYNETGTSIVIRKYLSSSEETIPKKEESYT